MRCYFLTVAKDWAHDTESHNVSVFHMVEEMQIPTDGAFVAGNICVVSGWERDPNEAPATHDVQVVVRAVDASEPVVTMGFELRVEQERYRSRTVGLAIPGQGRFRVEVRWRVQGTEEWTGADTPSWPLAVEVIAPPPDTTDPGTGP